jgi:SAM-dependent methyltransferase
MEFNLADCDGIISDAQYTDRLQKWPAARFKIHQKLVEKIVKLVGPGASGLDLGAGEGFFTKCCQENGLKVVALEGAKSAVEWSKDKLGIDNRVHNLKDPLPFQDDTLDFIMYYNVYEHVPQSINENVFREAFRVLKPNGLFFVYSTCKYDFVETADSWHINNPTPTGLSLLGKKHGFKADIRFPRFNISVFTPHLYDKNKNPDPHKKQLRNFLKKHYGLLRILTLPVIMPIWFLNSRFLHIEPLDFFCTASAVWFHKPGSKI